MTAGIASAQFWLLLTIDVGVFAILASRYVRIR